MASNETIAPRWLNSGLRANVGSTSEITPPAKIRTSM